MQCMNYGDAIFPHPQVALVIDLNAVNSVIYRVEILVSPPSARWGQYSECGFRLMKPTQV